jgi:hypothetical protein
MFCNLTNSHTASLSTKVIARLVEVHNKIEYKSINKLEIIKASHNDSSSEIFNRFCRLITYFSVISTFYLVVLLYIYPQIDKITNMRAKAFTIVYDSKVDAVLLNFWTRETLVSDIFSFDVITGGKSLFKAPELSVIELRDHLEIAKSWFISEDLQEIMSSATENLLFKINSGLEKGINSILNEIYLISCEINKESDIWNLLLFEECFTEYSTGIDVYYSSMSNDFSLKNEQLLILNSAFTVTYAFAAILFLAILFTLVIYSSERKIKNIQKLGEFIPVKQNAKFSKIS